MARRHGKKSIKYLGSRRWGHGSGKGVRGKGGRGGVGRAGIHKHRWLWKIKFEGTKGRRGFKSKRKKMLETNLGKLSKQVDLGKWPQHEGGYKIDLSRKRMKVLGAGELKHKLFVKAKAFSASAKKKIEELGGKTEEE